MQGALQAEDLRQLLCLEDKDIDLFSSIVERVFNENVFFTPLPRPLPLPRCLLVSARSSPKEEKKSAEVVNGDKTCKLSRSGELEAPISKQGAA